MLQQGKGLKIKGNTECGKNVSQIRRQKVVIKANCCYNYVGKAT